VVVGAKDDAGAGALFRAALAQPLSYRRIEWLDAAERPAVMARPLGALGR
jgi:hypothetical protein